MNERLGSFREIKNKNELFTRHLYHLHIKSVKMFPGHDRKQTISKLFERTCKEEIYFTK